MGPEWLQGSSKPFIERGVYFNNNLKLHSLYYLIIMSMKSMVALDLAIAGPETACCSQFNYERRNRATARFTDSTTLCAFRMDESPRSISAALS